MLPAVLVSLKKVLGVNHTVWYTSTKCGSGCGNQRVIEYVTACSFSVVLIFNFFFKFYWTRIRKESSLASMMKQFLISFCGEIIVLLLRLLS